MSDGSGVENTNLLRTTGKKFVEATVNQSFFHFTRTTNDGMQPFANKKVFHVVLITFCATALMVKSEECDFSAENMLEAIFSPNQPPSIQVQALRQDLLRRLTEALEDEGLNAWKRSFSSLARWNNLPHKRSLESLARGGYLRPRSVDGDPNLKRSISTLAKNGQFPNYQSADVEKRGIQSLARNGDLHHKREPQELMADLNEKRYLGSLARNYNFPAPYGKRSYYYYDDDKRNIASLARGGMKINGKREAIEDDVSEVQKRYFITGVQNALLNKNGKEMKNADVAKRSSVDGGREKRDADYYDEEYPSPVYQSQNDIDYEQLLKDLVDEYPNPEKRFLVLFMFGKHWTGSVARNGWFRPSSSSSSSSIRGLSASKRHIGALARLGWLPSFRSARRFSRSGRSTNECESRSSSADGQGEDDPFPENALSLDDKRFLLQPAVDKILLQKTWKQQPWVTQ